MSWSKFYEEMYSTCDCATQPQRCELCLRFNAAAELAAKTAGPLGWTMDLNWFDRSKRSWSRYYTLERSCPVTKKHYAGFEVFRLRLSDHEDVYGHADFTINILADLSDACGALRNSLSREPGSYAPPGGSDPSFDRDDSDPVD